MLLERCAEPLQFGMIISDTHVQGGFEMMMVEIRTRLSAKSQICEYIR